MENKNAVEFNVVTPKQEALLFKLLESKNVYLLDKWRVFDKLKEGTLSSREASGLIAFLFGIIAGRKVFPDLEFVTVKLNLPLVDEQ